MKVNSFPWCDGKMCIISKQILTVTLPQPELSNAVASLPTVYRRQHVYLPHSKFTGDWKKDCLPSSNPFCVQQLAGKQRAVGRQKHTATLPDACSVYRGKCQNSQLPGYSPSESQSFLQDGKTCREYSNALSLVLGGKNDFWSLHMCGLWDLTSPTTWLSTSKEVPRQVSGLCDKRRQQG